MTNPLMCLKSLYKLHKNLGKMFGTPSTIIASCKGIMMQLIQSFQNSRYCFRTSLRFLKKNVDLIILPVLSIIALVILLFSYIKVSIYYQITQFIFIVGLVIIYFLLAFVAVFFNAAFITCVLSRLQERKLSVFTGLLRAFKNSRALLQWTLISATLSVLLSALERLSDAIGKLIAMLFGFSWTTTSCFLLPTMLDGNVKFFTAFKRATQLAGKGWRNIGSLNLMVFLVLAALGGLAYLFASFFLHSQYTLHLTINAPLTLFLLICWFVSIKTFNAIYNSVLYLTLNGQRQHYFDALLLENMMINKKKVEFHPPTRGG